MLLHPALVHPALVHSVRPSQSHLGLTVNSVFVDKLVYQQIRELCEENRTVDGVGIGEKT